ncbi:hypothetical protein GGI00_004111, partial [Coemansia sp. RSA 2681]
PKLATASTLTRLPPIASTSLRFVMLFAVRIRRRKQPPQLDPRLELLFRSTAPAATLLPSNVRMSASQQWPSKLFSIVGPGAIALPSMATWLQC